MDTQEMHERMAQRAAREWVSLGCEPEHVMVVIDGTDPVAVAAGRELGLPEPPDGQVIIAAIDRAGLLARIGEDLHAEVASALAVPIARGPAFYLLTLAGGAMAMQRVGLAPGAQGGAA